MARRRAPSERPRPVGPVAVRLVALAGDEAGADRDVALVPADQVDEARKLDDRMLTVRVDAPGQLVAVLERVRIAGRDSRGQAEVPREAHHAGAVVSRDLGSAVGRAVVDDEHVGVRQSFVQLGEHGRKVRLLVPGGDEDEQPVAIRALLRHYVTPRWRLTARSLLTASSAATL